MCNDPMDTCNNNSGTFNGLGCNSVPQYPNGNVSYEPLVDLCDKLFFDEELGIEELEQKIWRDKQRLKRLKDMAKSGVSLLGQNDDDDDPESLSRRMMFRVQDGVLRYMFKAIDRAKAQGFVFGIVLKNGRTVTGSSDNLREWWKDKVRFDRNGPAAIMKYRSQVNPSDVTPKVGDSSAVKLLELQDTTLGALLSVLLPNCEPPQRRFPLNRGITPPWWPTGKEDYWNHLPLPDDFRGLPPPYKKPHDLKKLWKVGVLIGVIRHMSSKFDNITRIVSRSRTLQERMSSRDGSLWLAALSQEKADIDQNLPPLPASEVNNDGSCSLAPRNTGDMVPLFPEPQNYDVEWTNVASQVPFPEFDNNFNGGYKRRFEGDLGISIHPSIFMCENTQCLYSQPNMGFQDRGLRDCHQLTCPYRVPTIYQATRVNDMPSLMPLNPAYNQMQQQVQRNQEQFKPPNNLFRPTPAQIGGNNRYIAEMFEALSPSHMLLNQDSG